MPSRSHQVLPMPQRQVKEKDGTLRYIHVLPVVFKHSSTEVVFRIWILEDEQYLKNKLMKGLASPKDFKVAIKKLKIKPLHYAVYQNDLARGYYKSYKKNKVIAIE